MWLFFIALHTHRRIERMKTECVHSRWQHRPGELTLRPMLVAVPVIAAHAAVKKAKILVAFPL